MRKLYQFSGVGGGEEEMNTVSRFVVVGAGIAAAGVVAHADTVAASFTSGGLGVETEATSADGETVNERNSSGVDGAVVEAEGSSSSGLVSSFGAFRGEIQDVVPARSVGFTRITFEGSLGLLQEELGGVGFGALTTGSPSEPAPIIITIEEAAAFDISIQQFGEFESFNFEFVPVPNTGAAIIGDVLLPGQYSIYIFAELSLDENEFEDSAGFFIDIFLDGGVSNIIPLPGAAGLGLLGMGVLATRRRRPVTV
jgi:hypothetical protein